MASTPAHGERHIAQLIDDRAAETPDRPCYSIANSPSDSTKGWRDISYGQVANAVNIAAQWLVDTFGRKGSGFEVFAYIGPNDLRYAVITLAAMKTGYQALMVSPRNPIEAQHSLFAATKAIALLYAESSKVWIDPIVAADKVATHVVPSEADWLDAAPAKHFPLELNVTVEELAMLPAYVLHTSGSTGIPKPVFIKHGWLMAMDRFQIIRTKSGQAPFSVLYKKDDRMFASMPLFHASGLTQALPIAIFYEVIITFGPPNVPISADTFDTAVQYSKANVTMLPPSVLEDLASDPTHLATLKKLDFIVTGGGPSSLKTAEKLMEANVKAFSLISATEGIIPLLEPDNADFPYFRIDDELAGIDWRKVESAEEEDLYEMWIRRLPDWRHQGHFFTFPGTTEYNTKDICQKVPGRPGLWRYYARSDDVVVFSNGEKLNPIDIEGAVTDHPKVKGALVVGQGHFQAGLFVEPRDELKDDVSRAAFIDEIWPTVDKQNQMTVTHGHVLKGLIRVTSPEKPFPRAGKGTIQRASANALYKKEIEQLYKDEKSDSSVSAVELDLSSEAALAGSLVEAFASILESRGDALQADTDIFTVGVDSLGVLTMARKIKAGIQSQGVSVNDKLVSPRTIYANSTPQKLARALFTGIKDASANGSKENSTENAAEDSTAELQKLVREYSTGIPTVFPKKATAKEEVVIITGTTGGLGPYLLAETLGRSVAHVFALNRDPAAEKRQHASQVAKGLTANLSKVTFLTTDLSRPDLGLTEDDFKLIKSRATRIVHNAWPVNFNLPLDSFVPSIKGVRNLIDLAAASEHIAHIAFVSTIGTAAAAASPVQESNLPLEAARMGYGESKSISASILDAAREKGLSNAVIRVGQIAGSKAEAGQWNRAEWFPTIIASSAGMGLLPSDIGPQGKRVDWLPIEAVAGTIIDISEAGADGYYHTLNPAVTTYSELLPAITKYFGDRVKVVSYREWCAELEKFSQTAKGDADIEKVPGVKLLEFYQGNLRDGEPQIFETVRTEEASKTLAASTPVNASLMENWLRQWKF